MLFIPMMHCPSSILVMRLTELDAKGNGMQTLTNLQDKVENHNYSIDPEHAERVEDVQPGLESLFCRPSDDVLLTSASRLREEEGDLLLSPPKRDR